MSLKEGYYTYQEYNKDKQDLIFDTLAMAVSADSSAAEVALKSLSYLKHIMGVNTSLGVSNVSFGLPNRDFINSTFFAACLANGLSAAIINPNSDEIIKTYKSYCALFGHDENCLNYINYAQSVEAVKFEKTENKQSGNLKLEENLKYCIEKGLKLDSAKMAEERLKTQKPLELIDSEIIPALNSVGKAFENKTLFLPQLLMSAEAAAAAFEVIKNKFPAGANAKKLKVITATVEGDIHDIGKNIVKTLLINYGFNVFDLGKDVPPEKIVAAAKQFNANVVGLSALMTTTVVSMQKTVELLKAECPNIKTVVGGAVLTEEYAQKIGAFAYAKDAMETVRICESLEKQIN